MIYFITDETSGAKYLKWSSKIQPIKRLAKKPVLKSKSYIRQ